MSHGDPHVCEASSCRDQALWKSQCQQLGKGPQGSICAWGVGNQRDKTACIFCVEVYTGMCVITRKHQAWLQWEGLMLKSWVLTGCKLRASCHRDWSVWERSCWEDYNIRGSAPGKVIGLIQLVERSVHMAMNEATGRPGGNSYQVQWISTASSWINPLCVQACICMQRESEYQQLEWGFRAQAVTRTGTKNLKDWEI